MVTQDFAEDIVDMDAKDVSDIIQRVEPFSDSKMSGIPYRRRTAKGC